MTTIRANWWTIWTISTFLLLLRIFNCRTSMWTTSKVLFKNSAGSALEVPFEKGTSNFGCRYFLLYSHVFLMVVLKPWTMTTPGLKSWMLIRSHLDLDRSFFEHIILRAFLIDIDDPALLWVAAVFLPFLGEKTPKRMHSYHSTYSWVSIFVFVFVLSVLNCLGFQFVLMTQLAPSWRSFLWPLELVAL